MNLTQAREFICRFYHIFQVYSNRNLHFPHIKHCPNSFVIKRRLKSIDRFRKSFFWTSKQLFAIHFLLATCNVCPLAIPEFFAQTRVSDFNQLFVTGYLRHSHVSYITPALMASAMFMPFAVFETYGEHY